MFCTWKSPYTTKATKWCGITSKVHGLEVNQNFWKIWVYDHVFGWIVLHPSAEKFGHTPKISENCRSNFYIKAEELPNQELLKWFWITWWLLWCNFLKSIGHRPQPRIILIFTSRVSGRGYYQDNLTNLTRPGLGVSDPCRITWAENSACGRNQCSLLFEKSVSVINPY